MLSLPFLVFRCAVEDWSVCLKKYLQMILEILLAAGITVLFQPCKFFTNHLLQVIDFFLSAKDCHVLLFEISANVVEPTLQVILGLSCFLDQRFLGLEFLQKDLVEVDLFLGKPFKFELIHFEFEIVLDILLVDRCYVLLDCDCLEFWAFWLLLFCFLFSFVLCLVLNFILLCGGSVICGCRLIFLALFVVLGVFLLFFILSSIVVGIIFSFCLGVF